MPKLRVRKFVLCEFGMLRFAAVVAGAVLIGGSAGVIGLHYLNELDAAAPGVTDVGP